MTDRLKARGLQHARRPPTSTRRAPARWSQCRSGFDNEGKLLALHQVKTTARPYEPYPDDPPAGASDADCIVDHRQAA